MKNKKDMTIRKRLFISNIIMIVIPVISTILAGLICAGLIWLFFVSGAGLKVSDSEDFNVVCQAMTEMAERNIQSGGDYSVLEEMMDFNGIEAQIISEGKVIYSYGDEDHFDDEVFTDAKNVGGDMMLRVDGRNIYHSVRKIDNSTYDIYFVSGNYLGKGDYGTLKVLLGLSAIVIAFVVFISVILTNRFLTSFVFEKIEEPLDILGKGVGEIAEGNLDYQISYDYEDEFTPVCNDFNDMARHLKESVDTIQSQEKSRKELLAGISHDIRSPLTSIQAYVEGLLDGVASTEEMKKHYLEVIHDKTLDLDRLVSQLFLFSKMDMGEFPETPEIIKLDETIKDILDNSLENYQNQGLSISEELNPVPVNADPVWIQRIVSNILDNSVKYKNKDEGHAEIKLYKEDDKAILTISDDGPGVPEENLPYIFDVFYRADSARKDPGKGSGLGLAIVSRTIEHMGGTVSAEKSDMGGLEVKMSFPLTDKKETENE
ncbi:MAG: HAMP domain-containing sensor histidine kinase [Erysipelotrichaceae bacterium]|nr:HAMP domain-containing sensor histidine kinase [Erysipelotrichaceae bacterium]